MRLENAEGIKVGHMSSVVGTKKTPHGRGWWTMALRLHNPRPSSKPIIPAPPAWVWAGTIYLLIVAIAIWIG